MLNLSLVIPAYDEAKRLPPYLVSIRNYLDLVFPDHYEVVVVDDGSQDDLPSLLEGWAASWPQLSYLRHRVNQGKGAAVKSGILAARGELLLFADADGATPIEQEAKLRQAIENGADVAVGSRLLPQATVSRHRVWHRRLSGRFFAWVVRRLLRLSVRDTQCGFKMSRREAARQLFHLCRETRFLFDLEVLVWAQRLGYRVAEVPVSWKDVPGSKVRLIRDGWQMLRGVWALRHSLQREISQRRQESEDKPAVSLAGDLSPAPTPCARR